jgi:hypothetical protein
MYTVAVSYLEWIRWVATGWFRCADRVVWLEGVEDQQGMDALMDCTPDLQVSDDQGYVIACLRPDALIPGRINGRERSVGNLWISIAAVFSFHPLSTRGARLLEADAERAAVRLGVPSYEKLWVDWRDRRLEDEAHWRGLSLCAAFGLENPELKKIPELVIEVLAGRKPAPNLAELREGAFEDTRALGWAAAMSLGVTDPELKASFKEMPEYGEIRALIKKLKEDFDLRRSLLDDGATIQLTENIDRVLRDLGADILPLGLMAATLHYRNLASRGKEVSLEGVLGDLTQIALRDPRHASLAAYFIGRSMENVAVTTLLYQSDPVRYNALTPRDGRHQLDVMARAAARCESELPSDQAEQIKSHADNTAVLSIQNGSSDELTAGAAVERSDQLVSNQLQADPNPAAHDDGNAEVVISEPSQSDSSREGMLTEGSKECVVPRHADSTSNLSEFGVAAVDQAEKINEATNTELFQPPADGNLPDNSSPKSQKKRKKEEKIPEIMSGSETFDDKLDK